MRRLKRLLLKREETSPPEKSSSIAARWLEPKLLAEAGRLTATADAISVAGTADDDCVAVNGHSVIEGRARLRVGRGDLRAESPTGVSPLELVHNASIRHADYIFFTGTDEDDIAGDGYRVAEGDVPGTWRRRGLSHNPRLQTAIRRG